MIESARHVLIQTCIIRGTARLQSNAADRRAVGLRYSRNVSNQVSNQVSNPVDTSPEPFMTTLIDVRSVQQLASGALRMSLVDTSDAVALAQWFSAESRGFHDSQPTPEKLAVILPHLVNRRTTGVFDDSGADAAAPVATISSWPMNLTLPGETALAAWSISSVTVSPTHRRRGIARAMLEAELRTANTLGFAVAILTVSEATIYGRYGFGASVMSADWTIDTARAKWSGPTASGRVQFTTADDLLLDGYELVKQAILDTPGEVEFSGILWERLLVRQGDPDASRALRIVRYDDVDGDLTGFAVYRVKALQHHAVATQA